jgi:integrase
MELPNESTPRLRVLSEAEEKALCGALREPYALWVRLAILTGLKQSEQFTLALARYRPSTRLAVAAPSNRFLTGLSTLPAKPRAYLLLFVTGCRRGKALAMQWTEVDLKTRLMRKPKTKNGHSHLLPLPMQVIEVLQELPRLNPWFFPGKAVEKPGRVPWHVAHFDPLTLKRGLSLLGPAG